MKCPYCKEEIEDNSKVCPICGEKIVVLSKVLKIFLVLLHLMTLSTLIYIVQLCDNDYINPLYVLLPTRANLIGYLQNYTPLFSTLFYWIIHMLSMKTNFRLIVEDKFLIFTLHVLALSTFCYIIDIFRVSLIAGEIYFSGGVDYSIIIFPLPLKLLLLCLPIILTVWYWIDKLVLKNKIEDNKVCSICGEKISSIYNILDFLKTNKKKILSTTLFILLTLLIYFIYSNISNYYHFNKALNNKDFTGHIILVEAGKNTAFKEITKGVQYKLYAAFGDDVYIAKYYKNKAVIYADEYISSEDITAVMSKPFLMFKKKGSGDTWVDTGITETLIKKSYIDMSPDNNRVLVLEFNKKGTEKFANLTKELVGKPLAIFYNGRLISEPIVREPILSGWVQIPVEGFYDEAERMSNIFQVDVNLKVIEVKP